jgi:hypothetical protein
LRFYLKYIEKRLRQIQQNQLLNITISNLPGWHSMMGMQFENLVLNNRLWIKEQLSYSAQIKYPAFAQINYPTFINFFLAE